MSKDKPRSRTMVDTETSKALLPGPEEYQVFAGFAEDSKPVGDGSEAATIAYFVMQFPSGRRVRFTPDRPISGLASKYRPLGVPVQPVAPEEPLEGAEPGGGNA